MSFATCEYIKQGGTIIIPSPTGAGKSWLASALGYQACLSGFKTSYYGMQRLFEHITI